MNEKKILIFEIADDFAVDSNSSEYKVEIIPYNGRFRRVVKIETTEEIQREVSRMNYIYDVNQRRSSRKLVPAERGKYKRCSGKCSNCQNDCEHPELSLEKFLDEYEYDPIDPDLGPEEQIVLKDTIDYIRKKLKESGGKDCKKNVLLFDLLLSEMTVTEISKYLDKPQQTVDRWVKKVRQIVKLILEEGEKM